MKAFEIQEKRVFVEKILRPKIELAEFMKESAERALQEVRLFTEKINNDFAAGNTDSIRSKIL